MILSGRGVALIKRYEGFSDVPYICPAGYPTIGYGHVIRKNESFVKITKFEAQELLISDVQSACRAVSRLTLAPLNQNQFDALVSFVFNLGAGQYQASTLRQVINRGWYDEAPRQFKRWVFSKGRKLPGLVIRRDEEAALFMEPIS